jgi:hypothetical protein
MLRMVTDMSIHRESVDQRVELEDAEVGIGGLRLDLGDLRRGKAASSQRCLSEGLKREIRADYLRIGSIDEVAKKWHMHSSRIVSIIIGDQSCLELYNSHTREGLPEGVQVRILLDRYLLKKSLRVVRREYRVSYKTISAVTEKNPELIRMIEEAKEQMLGELLGEVAAHMEELKSIVRLSIKNLSDPKKRERTTPSQETHILKEMIHLFEDRGERERGIVVSEEERAAHDMFVACFTKRSAEICE